MPMLCLKYANIFEYSISSQSMYICIVARIFAISDTTVTLNGSAILIIKLRLISAVEMLLNANPNWLNAANAQSGMFLDTKGHNEMYLLIVRAVIWHFYYLWII